MAISQATKIEKPIRKEVAQAKIAAVPHHMKVNSIVWDDELPFREPLDFHNWVDALFDVRPPISIATFEPAKERDVFTSTLVRGINWNYCEEVLVGIEEDAMDPSDVEALMTLIELVRLAGLRETDLRKVRLSRRPKE